jgi:hypothetical protein
MIISHNHKFIFVKNRKVAGTSVEAYLSQYCGKHDIITTGGENKGRNDRGIWNPCAELISAGNFKKRCEILSDFIHFKKYKSHMGSHLIQTRLPKKTWQSYYKFCIERNPWDKTLSFYHMKKHNPNLPNKSFDQFLSCNHNLCSDFDRYCGRDGKILVDRVLRYENLLSDLSEVCEKLRIPFDGDLGFKINSQFRTDRRCYRDVYTDSQRRVVETIYKREIDLLGYEF